MQGSVLLIISLFFISVFSPISGIAADLSWRPRVEVGALYYKFDDENALRVRQNTLFAQEGIEIESWMPFVGGRCDRVCRSLLLRRVCSIRVRGQ